MFANRIQLLAQPEETPVSPVLEKLNFDAPAHSRLLLEVTVVCSNLGDVKLQNQLGTALSEDRPRLSATL